MTTGHRLAEGTTLGGGRYVIDAVLGQGGFGVTYRATDTQLHRPVAIKEFFLAGSTRVAGLVQPPPGLEGEFTDRLERIRDEARALARFRHPSIVTVHEFLEDNGTIYVVMELLRGRSLKQVMGGGALPEDQAIRYASEIAGALDAIHAEQLLHRDVKPDNIMVMEDGHVALVDFGTAREFSAGQSSLMSQTLTPGYAPVEQYTAHGRFGPATDVYALGATTYHMLAGVPPVPSLDRYTGSVELTAPRDVNPAVSQAASDAVVWALALAPNDRPQSAGQFAAALRGIMAAGTGTRAPAGGTTRIVDPGTAPPPPVREPVTTPPPVRPPPPVHEPRPPVRRRAGARRVRRGARKIGRVIINLAITIAIGIAATFAVTWFLDRNDDTPVVNTQAPDPQGQPAPTQPPPPDDAGEENPTPQETTPAAPPTQDAAMLLAVVDVAADDTLNVRAGPGVGFAPPIAELAPDAVGVAATGSVANIGRSYWAEVALDGGVAGWASLNFLDAEQLGEELALTERLRTSVAGVLLSEPGLWVVTAETDARRGPGAGFELVVRLAPGSVVESTGDAALVVGAVWAEVTGEGLPPSWLPSDVLDVTSGPDFLGQPTGRLCADLAGDGFDYSAAHAYWEWDGRPDRMDADTDGIPCETIYAPQEVVFFQSLRGEV